MALLSQTFLLQIFQFVFEKLLYMYIHTPHTVANVPNLKHGGYFHGLLSWYTKLLLYNHYV